MANPRLRLLLRAAGPPPPPADQVPDGELLRRFVASRDPAAFEALVWRHGPMVRAVCRQVLRDVHDADDAFQATFLVLVRRAEAVRAGAAVGGWLYRVAYRVAHKLRDQLARRVPTSETLAMTPAPDIPPPSADLAAAIDEEIAKLPDKYREPVQLCYVAGVGTAEAARRLGLAKGTLLTRLAWARKRLRENLANRGITLTIGSLTAALGSRAVTALPPDLVRDTVQSAVAVLAGGGAVAGVVSEQTLSLSDGVVQAMLWNKIRLAAGLMVLTVAVVGAGLGHWMAPANAQDRTKGEPRTPPTAKARPSTPAPEPLPGPDPDLGSPRLEIPTPIPASPRIPPPTPLSAPIAKRTYQFEVPSGTWTRQIAGTENTKVQVNVKIEEERLNVTFNAPRPGGAVMMTIEADYSVNKESLLYGVVTMADVLVAEGVKDDGLFAAPLEDQLFSFRFRVDGSTLTIKDVRFPGMQPMEAEMWASTLAGRYTVAPAGAPKPSNEKPMRSVPRKPQLPANRTTPSLPPVGDTILPFTEPLPKIEPTSPGPSIPPVGPLPSVPKLPV